MSFRSTSSFLAKSFLERLGDENFGCYVKVWVIWSASTNIMHISDSDVLGAFTTKERAEKEMEAILLSKYSFGMDFDMTEIEVDKSIRSRE